MPGGVLSAALVAILLGSGVWAALGADDGKELALVSSGAKMRGGAVVVWWQPEQKPGISGFYLERRDSLKGTFSRVNSVIVPMPLPFLAEQEPCEVVDKQAAAGRPQTYRLTIVWFGGAETASGLFDATPVAEASAAMAKAVLAVAPELAPAPLAVAGERVKITIEKGGLYYLSPATIAANLDGWDESSVVAAIGSGAMRMTCGSNDVAWLAASGGTGLYFFAEAISSIYTRQNVYWLEPGPGSVMALAGGTAPAPVVAQNTYRASFHYEQDTPGYFGETAYTNTEADIWFWALVRGGYADKWTNAILNLDVSAVPTGQQKASVTVHLKGTNPSTNAPDHRASFYMNGKYLGQTNWDDFAECDPPMAVTNLVGGTNVFRVLATKLPGDTLGTYFLIQSVDLEYDRLYRAASNAVVCTGGTNATVGVSGFTTNDLRVLDVTRPYQPMVVDAAAVDLVSNGDYRVSFVPQTPTNRYLAACGALSPVSVSGRRSQGWRQPTNEADFVVIAPAAFKAQADALAAYRAGQGLKAASAEVEDIYDEFNGGVVSPHAIRSFVAYALGQWATPPQYVVLAGAGTMDYKDVNNAWALDPCLIPPLTILSQQRLYGSDNPLADVNGDRAPDLALGRLPVANTNEFQGWLDKMMAFEANAAGRRTVAMIADNADVAGDFPASSDGLVSEFSQGYVADRNYLSTQTTAQVRSRLFASLNGGCSLMTYIGHANVARLADETILSISPKDDVGSLTNRSSAPVILGLTCEFGRFERPSPSGMGRIGDRLVRKVGGGAVAVWSAITSVDNEDSVRLGHFLLQRLFCRDNVRLGEAARQALVMERSVYPASRLLDSYSLLGDPAMCMFLLGKRGSISGRVLVDVAGDGVAQGADTNGLAAVTVQLLDTNDVVLAAAATDAAGGYIFTNLLLGTYTVVETDPAGYISTLPADNRRVVVLASEATSSGHNFLDTAPASIGGWVLFDPHGNGEGGAPQGLAGVTVQLQSTNGVVLATAVTEADGRYLFSNVPPGTYVVVEVDPPGCVSLSPLDNRHVVTTLSGQDGDDNNFLDMWAPSLAVSPAKRDFGTVLVNTTNPLVFTVENTGGGSLTGSVGGVSAPFSVAGTASYVLAGGASTNITLRFVPTTAGTYSNDVAFDSSAGELSRPVTGAATNPPSGIAEFFTHSYSAAENGGAVTVTVVRTGGSFGGLSASFAATHGTATAGSDYAATHGTLIWGDGDTAAKGFVVGILDDTAYESNETFSVTLSGAALGPVTNTTVTVLDDDQLFIVTPDNQAVPATAGTTTFSVANAGNGTMSYTTSESETWLSIAGGGTGVNSGTITVSYFANSVATQRIGTLTVSAPGAAGSPKTVTVTQAAHGPDFVVANLKMTPPDPATGRTFTATVTVRNQGTLAGKAGYLSLWVSHPGVAATGERGETRRSSADTLKPGRSRVLTFRGLVAPRQPGAYTLRAFVDSQGGTKENDDGNNQAALAYQARSPYVDLAVVDVDFAPLWPLPGSRMTTYITLQNRGNVPSSSSRLSVWADQPGEAACGAPAGAFKTEDALRPWRPRREAVTGLVAPDVAGNYVLRAFLDSACVVVESTETNNQGTLQYAVYNATPNLAVKNIELSTSSPRAGQLFSATAKVKNIGTGSGAAGRLGVWMNRVTAPGLGDTPDAYVDVAGILPVGATASPKVAGLVAPPAGRYTMWVWVDADGVTAEQSEADNALSLDYTVQP